MNNTNIPTQNLLPGEIYSEVAGNAGIVRCYCAHGTHNKRVLFDYFGASIGKSELDDPLILSPGQSFLPEQAETRRIIEFRYERKFWDAGHPVLVVGRERVGHSGIDFVVTATAVDPVSMDHLIKKLRKCTKGKTVTANSNPVELLESQIDAFSEKLTGDYQAQMNNVRTKYLEE